MTIRGSSTDAATARGTLFLVRHGQSTWNLAGRIQGQSPAAGGLTPTGRAEAARAARHLAGHAPNARAIVSSDLLRTAETAEIVADALGLPVEFDPELREQRLGIFEGRHLDAPASPVPGTVGEAVDRLWHDPFVRAPGGESVAGMYQRVRGALRRIAASRAGADVIVVTHGGPVRVARLASPPEPSREIPRTPVANASVTAWAPPSGDGGAATAYPGSPEARAI